MVSQEEFKKLQDAFEQQRQRADVALEQQRQRADVAEEKLRQTTLTEYLSLCHTHLSKSISIQRNITFSTKGTPGNAKNKCRPDNLKPWEDYLQQHKDTSASLYSDYPYPQPQVFHNRISVQTMGKDVASTKISSESDLQYFVRQTMETPMTHIMQHLQSLDHVRDRYDLPRVFRFENHGNALSDTSSEDELMSDAQPPLPSTPGQTHDASEPKPRPDQFCIYTTVNNLNRVAFVAEFKAPHKLPLEQLKRLLGSHRDEIKLDQIVNRIKTPARHKTKACTEQQYEEQLAEVITQTFSYMVRCETQYGYVTTGEALVFLHIKLEDDVKTAYYYLAEPNRNDLDTQGEQHPVNSNPLLSFPPTALSHLITFSIHALQSARQNQTWRERLLPGLKTWKREDQSVLDQLTQTPSPAGEISEAYEPDSEESPTSSRPPKRPRGDCGPGTPTAQNRNHSPSPPPDGSSRPSNPARPAATTNKQYRQPPPREKGYTDSRRRQRAYSYCTQRCLQGLARGGPLDQRCPNVSKHCEEGYQGNRHELSCEEFSTLLEKQLRRSRGEDFCPLGIQGARGALFKVTLMPYNYTVVAKGTVRPYVRYLRHEAEVYRRLAALQGDCVPVFLGSLDLQYEFYYDAAVRIVHMMLLSWSGERLNPEMLTDTDRHMRISDAIRAVDAIHKAGVVHRDVRIPNLLWSEETKRVIVIDFERADIVSAARQAPSAISNKKRKQLSGMNKKGDGVIEAMKASREIKYRAELDICAAEAIFTESAPCCR